jgi:hypothetical protein
MTGRNGSRLTAPASHIPDARPEVEAVHPCAPRSAVRASVSDPYLAASRLFAFPKRARSAWEKGIRGSILLSLQISLLYTIDTTVLSTPVRFLLSASQPSNIARFLLMGCLIASTL